MRKKNTTLSLIFFFSKRHLRVPLSVCKNLPANVFCCNHLHRTYINSLVKSNRFESNKHAFQAKRFDRSENTRDSKFIRTADFVAALARSRCF